jgi:hypothetical protein
VCCHSARSSGQQVDQRRLSGEYIAGIEAKPKTPNNRSGQRCGNSCRTAFSVRRRTLQTSSNPYSDPSSCPKIHKALSLSAFQSIRQQSQRSCFFVCNLLDFSKGLTKLPKIQEGYRYRKNYCPKIRYSYRGDHATPPQYIHK